MYQPELDKEIQQHIDHFDSTFNWNKEDLILQLKKKREQLTDSIDKQNLQLVAQLDEELVDLKAQKKRLASLYAVGKIETDSLDELTDEVDAQIQEIEIKKQNSVKTNADILAEIKQIETHIGDLKNRKFNSDNIKNVSDLLKHIDKIIVHSKKQPLEFKFTLFEAIGEIQPLYSFFFF